MQELHLLETSELHFLYSDEEAQALSVILVWALARPARAARAAADATKKLVDGMVEIVDSAICIETIYIYGFRIHDQIDCSRSRSSRSGWDSPASLYIPKHAPIEYAK
jgi:hypothetical protein